MKLIYKYFLKPILFLFPPEFTHNLFLFLGNLLSLTNIGRKLTALLFRYSSNGLNIEVDGIKYKNPVGLAAGFDKQVDLINILESTGFGFMELGSITFEKYKGNKKPRLLRLKKSKGILVNYGLKNLGVEKTIKRFKEKRIEDDLVIGVSVAKTNSPKTVDQIKGIEDYVLTLKQLAKENVGDYYTINISCPNAFGGEPFTTPKKLELLLREISLLKIQRPVYIKMPIELPWKDFDNLLKVIIKYRFNGVVIGNLTKDRERIKEKLKDSVKGGISGKPCEELSNSLIEKTYKKYGRQLTIIGTGGIFSAKDAYKKIKLGASLIQLITGMIYEGPTLMKEINFGIERLMIEDGYTNIKEVIGRGI